MTRATSIKDETFINNSDEYSNFMNTELNSFKIASGIHGFYCYLLTVDISPLITDSSAVHSSLLNFRSPVKI